MRTTFKPLVCLAAALLLASSVTWAHHGSAISYDTSTVWSTMVTVKDFYYKNPHPSMTFTRTTKDGQVEEWVSELLTNISQLARRGWTRGRSEEALKPGARVKVYLATSRAGGFSATVMGIENEKGEPIVFGGGERTQNARDLDGVPGGLQPQTKERLPGQTN